MTVTLGIDQTLDPRAWRSHRFGLSAGRWSALESRGFWVTGAGTGFGRAIATALAAAGATVYLSGRRREMLEGCRAAVAEFGIQSARCHVLPLDIENPTQITAAAALIAHGTGLHGVVNCAALPEPVGEWPLTEIDPAQWARLLSVNVTGSWLVTRAALPVLARSGAMRVLFLTSEAGWASTSGFGPYNVSKAALNSLAMSLAEEVAARHPGLDVQINVLIPGEARSDMNRGSTESPFAAVPMALALLSHPVGGPNGRFFHRDGRHFAFAYAQPWDRPLTEPGAPMPATQPSWSRALLARLSR